MKSFFFQVLYCGYKSFGWCVFTKGRNPCGRNENSNTIYSSDPAHGSDAGAEEHSRGEDHSQILITCNMFILARGSAGRALYSQGTCWSSGRSFKGFTAPLTGWPWYKNHLSSFSLIPAGPSSSAVSCCFHWDSNVGRHWAWLCVEHEQKCSSSTEEDKVSRIGTRFMRLIIPRVKLIPGSMQPSRTSSSSL